MRGRRDGANRSAQGRGCLQGREISALAFWFWAAAVIDEVALIFHLDTEPKRAFLLSFAAFALPLLDSISIRRNPTPPRRTT
ncbi:hypothetical protein GCM10027020_08030 [Nocardioides salsibiostraticola]